MIVTLPDRQEQALKAKAEAHGVSAEQYVQQIVDRDLEATESESLSVWDVFAESRFIEPCVLAIDGCPASMSYSRDK